MRQWQDGFNWEKYVTGGDALRSKKNPATEGGAGEKPKKGKAKGVKIRPYRPVLPGHLWIGIEEKN